MLITEFKMPERTGIEVIEQIGTFIQLSNATISKNRSKSKKLTAPVIFMMFGYYQLSNFVEQCKKQGVSEFLEKPISEPELYEALRKHNFIPS